LKKKSVADRRERMANIGFRVHKDRLECASPDPSWIQAAIEYLERYADVLEPKKYYELSELVDSFQS